MFARSRTAVLVAASGAPWEARAVQLLGSAAPTILLLKRCVDLSDLLASATTGQAQVALVAHDLPGLDADSVTLLRRAGVAVVMVADRAEMGLGDEARMRRLGIEHLVVDAALTDLTDAVLAAGAETEPSEPVTIEPPSMSVPPATGRMLAVWGPTGAPGRTTVAVGVAAELAHRGLDALLVDADTFGGAVAQHLGVLDEASGLLAAARMANTGQLEAGRLSTLVRQVNPALGVLTGLPRADRWTEVREPAFERVLDLARGMASYTVLDTAFSLEQDVSAPFGSTAPQRNGMTLAALERADEVLVVGAADPVGLARLARGLVELLEAVTGCTVRVIVNRTRPSLGWGQHEVRAMIEGFVTPASVHFLPEDRVAADRALVSGRTLVESTDSSLRRGVAEVVDALTGDASSRRRRRRLLSRWSQRRDGHAPNSSSSPVTV